jgi:putative ABC transport system permease protein
LIEEKVVSTIALSVRVRGLARWIETPSRALADAARPPRRRALLIRASRRLPVPLLLGLRLVARRPRRALLTAASIAVTVSGIVAVLAFHATASERKFGGSSGLANPVAMRAAEVTNGCSDGGACEPFH